MAGSFHSMGTTITVTPATALKPVKEVFECVDLELSEWKNQSPLSQVNQSAGLTPTQCPQSVCDAVALSLSVAMQTDGAYDPTWASMWELWNFKNPILPSQEEITSRLPLVNWRNVQINDSAIYLTEEGMMLGLGGIAKGIALNESRDALLSQGCKEFMIVSGGQVLVNGSSRQVGIRKPDGLHNEFVAIVELKNTSISTSGDYEQYFEVDGVRYHHIIDPRTGFPAKGTRSVTVISEDAALADALSTGLFVMGSEKAIALVNSIPGVEAYIIDSAGSLQMSSNFAKFLCNANSVEGSASSDLIPASDQ